MFNEKSAVSPSLAERVTRQSSLRGNVVANYAGRLWEAAMSVAFVPLYIAYLGAEAYGVIGMVALIQAFMLILDFGLTPTLTRETARFEAGERDALYVKDLVRSVETVTLAVAIVIVAAVALAASFISSDWVRAASLGETSIADAITIGGALIATRLFESIYRGALYGLQRQVLANAIAAIFATVRGGGAVLVIALTDSGLREFFAWQLGISVLAVVAMRVSVRSSLPHGGRHGRFSWSSLSAVWQFAAGMLMISILSLAATQADKIVLSRLISLEDFGYYVFAANLALVIQLVFAPAMTAVYPRIVGFIAKAQDVELRATFHRMARIIAALTAPIAALLVIFGETLIRVWSGDPVLASNAGPLLSIIALATFLHAQCVLPYYVQLGYGWTSLSVWTNAAALFITVPSLIFLVPRFGAMAGAWTWLAVASVYFFVALQVMFARYLRGARSTFFFGDVAVPALAAFGTTALCSLGFNGLPDTLLANLFLLTASLALSFTASAGSALAIHAKLGRREGRAPFALM